MRLTLVTLVLVGLVVGALPIADAFADGPYRGRVIDAETKEPLAGAVVLVYWIRNAPAIGHGPAQSFLGAEEALTDDRGEFIVAENPPSNWIPFTWRSLPNFIIFQPGYGYFPRHFATTPPLPPTGFEGLLKIMEKQPVVFELPRLTTREDRLKAALTVNPLVIPKHKIPNFIRLLDDELRTLPLPREYEQR
jgi:hypothetical protein